MLKFCKKIGHLDEVLNWLDTYKDDITPLRLDAIGLWLYQEKMGRKHSIDFESLLDMTQRDALSLRQLLTDMTSLLILIKT